MSGEVFGDYLLERRLGAGGMAVTWRARERIGGIGERFVALKQILPEHAQDPEFRTMFFDEVRIASQIHHRNVCQIYRAGDHAGTLFMAMEYVDGSSVSELVASWTRREAGPMPVEHALYLISEVLGGLDAAHTLCDVDGRPLHIVHRDVSPQNVLVSSRGEVKLIDFGIARATSNDSRTQTGHIKGKVLYLCPEQLEGKAPDARGDLFSAGLMLYEWLTGTHPLRGDSEMATLFNFATREIEPPSSVSPGLGPHVDALVMGALQRDANARWPSARAMAEAALDALHELVPGYRPSHFEAFVRAASDPIAPLDAISAVSTASGFDPGRVMGHADTARMSAIAGPHGAPAEVTPATAQRAAPAPSPAHEAGADDVPTTHPEVPNRNWLAIGVTTAAIALIGGAATVGYLLAGREGPDAQLAGHVDPDDDEDDTRARVGNGDPNSPTAPPNDAPTASARANATDAPTDKTADDDDTGSDDPLRIPTAVTADAAPPDDDDDDDDAATPPVTATATATPSPATTSAHDALAAALAARDAQRQASGGRDLPESALMLRELDPYADCLTRVERRAREGQLRYLDWVANPDSGPTCRETVIYGTYVVYDDGIERCETAAAAADVATLTADLAAPLHTLAKQFSTLWELTRAADRYYDSGRYKRDDCAWGKTNHSALMASWDQTLDSTAVLTTTMTTLRDDAEADYMAWLETTWDGHDVEWHARNVLLRYDRLLLAADDLDPVSLSRVDAAAFADDLDALAEAIDAFALAVDAEPGRAETTGLDDLLDDVIGLASDLADVGFEVRDAGRVEPRHVDALRRPLLSIRLETGFLHLEVPVFLLAS